MLEKLTNNVYYMPHYSESDRPALGLVFGDTHSILIDSGNSPAHANDFLALVNKMDIPPVKLVVITHWHWDHVFGINTLDLLTISHEDTKKQIDYMTTLEWDDASIDERVKSGEEIEFCRDMIKREMPTRDYLQLKAPDISFSDRLEIDLGNKTCVLEHVGGVHAQDSVIAYIPEDKIMFLADCLYEDFYSGDYSYDLQKLTTLLEKIKKHDVNYYVLGHQPPKTYDEMWDFLDDLISIGEIVAEEVDLKKATTEFKTIRNATPTDDQLEHIGHFVSGNKKKLKK